MLKLLAALACALCLDGAAAITVHDDDGKQVTLDKPARRVIALAPHVAEMLYAAGGGDRIIAAVDYADYPEQAKALPRVGNYRLIDLERVAALRPDLIVVWLHGTSERKINQIRALGIPMFHSEPKKLDDIAATVIRLGRLMGTEPVADAVAAGLRGQLASLSAKYAGRPRVRMFYQVWDQPLYTLNGGHIVSDAMRLCGGENIFGKLKVTAPVVGVEAVVQEDPEAIFSTAERSGDEGGIGIWRKFPNMTAVKRANLFRVDSDLLNRSGPRMLAGAQSLCEKLELARQRRKTP